MILDYENMLADGQAITASAASTNIIDRGADGDLGHGEPMAVVINVTVAADNTTTDETYAFAYQECTAGDADFSPAGEVVSRTIAATALTAGSQHVLVIPPGACTKRYSRLYATLGGTTPSITYSAHLVPLNHVQAWTGYPGNV